MQHDAVSRLIQHGADLRNGVLHRLVRASAINRDKTPGYLKVFRAIVDNAVIYSHLETDNKYPKRESIDYPDELRQVMIELMSTDDVVPPTTYSEPNASTLMKIIRKTFLKLNQPEPKVNVIESAIDYGAFEMITEIYNTMNVYKFVNDECVLYDVSNIIEGTMLVAGDDTKVVGGGAKTVATTGLHYKLTSIA